MAMRWWASAVLAWYMPWASMYIPRTCLYLSLGGLHGVRCAAVQRLDASISHGVRVRLFGRSRSLRSHLSSPTLTSLSPTLPYRSLTTCLREYPGPNLSAAAVSLSSTPVPQSLSVQSPVSPLSSPSTPRPSSPTLPLRLFHSRLASSPVKRAHLPSLSPFSWRPFHAPASKPSSSPFSSPFLPFLPFHNNHRFTHSAGIRFFTRNHHETHEIIHSVTR